MKAVVGIFLLSLASSVIASTTNQKELKAFEKFKVNYARYPPKATDGEFQIQHTKRYKNPSEELKAFKQFSKVFKIIEKHNKDEENGKVEFTLAINRYADFTDEEIEIITNGNQLPPYEFSNFTVRPKDVINVTPEMFPPGPPTWDWKAKGKVTPVKDQGSVCACCWAFSAVAALESALAIKTGVLEVASEQNLIDCNRNDATGNYGCKGGSMAAAFMYVQLQPGVSSSESYPYQEDVVHPDIFKCRYNRETSIGTTIGYGRIRPLDEVTLKNVVAAVGPVAFGFNSSPRTFMFYSVGIYDDPACTPGTGHSALIYGYGTAKYKNGTSVDFWLCKNSWSSDWGDNGYFKMVRGKNMCGLTSYLIYPMV